MLSITTKQRHNILHSQFTNRLSTFNSRISQFTFCFLEIEDPFFDCIGDGEAVDYYVDCLVETVDAVDGLFLYELWGLLALVLMDGGEGDLQDSRMARE